MTFCGVKVICQGQGHIFQIVGVTGAIVFHKHILLQELQPVEVIFCQIFLSYQKTHFRETSSKYSSAFEDGHIIFLSGLN